MFKKILFYGVTFILGIMLLLTSYYGFYASYNQTMTYGAIENNDYDRLAEIFIPFFNKEKALDVIEEEKFQIVAYEGVVGEKTKVTIDSKEHDAYRYQDSVVFFVNKVTYSLDGISQGENQPTINYSGLNFYNTIEETGEVKSYTYTLNDPVDAASDTAEGVKRFHASAAKTLNFFEVDLSTKIINDSLGGAIDKIEVVDGKKEVVSTITLNEEITVTGTFYEEVAPLIKTYDECLATNDGKRFNEFFQEFIKAYNENPNFGVSLSDKERKPVSIYVKTGAVMVAFIAAAVLIGYFLFRKKNKVLKPYEVDELMAEVKAEDEQKKPNEDNVIDAEIKDLDEGINEVSPDSLPINEDLSEAKEASNKDNLE